MLLRPTTISLSALVGAVLIIAGSARAAMPTASLVVELITLSEKTEFERKGNRYHVDAVRVEMRTRITGTGLLQEMQQDKTEVDTEVPGKDDKGHFWFELKKQPDGTIHLFQDELVDLEGKTYPLVVSAPVVFVEGSYDAYKRDKPVQVQFTDQGQAQVEKKTKKLMQTILQLAFKELEGAVPGARLKVTIDELDLGNEPIHINGDKARQVSTKPTTIKATIALLVDA